MGTTIEVREPNETPRSFEINGAAVVGRDETVAIRLSDPTISRSHAQIEPVPGGLSVVDLDSSNGTWVAGVRSQPHTSFVVPVGGEVRFGDTVVVVHAAAPAASQPAPPPSPLSPPRASGPPRPPVPPTTPSPPVPVAAAPQGRMLRREIDGAVIHYREGSVGERVAGAFAASFQRARRRLAGFGSEAWGVQVSVYLVDPFPDPGEATRLITSGSVVNARANEIWMAVTAESPPESPERSLALLFGSVLPAAAEIEYLVEGYGLFVADSADPDPLLRGNALPPFDATEGDLRAAMALSFVQFLVARGGREPFKRMLSTAQPGRLEAASEEHFGVALGSLEDEWRMLLVSGQDKVKPTQFLRLSAQYLRPHTRRELELGFYMLLSLAFTMAFPFISKRLFDTAIPSGEFSQVLQLLAILGVAFVISLLAGLRQAYVGAYVSGAIVRDIRGAMFDRLQFLSYGWFARHQQGDILSRMFNDVALLERGISETLLQGVMQLLTLAVAAFVVLKLSPLLGIIVLLGAPAVAIVYRLMSKGAQKRSLAVQERQSALLAVAAENYSAQPVVKGFGLEDRERNRFGAALNRLFLSERKLSIFGGLFGLTVNLIVTALRLFVLGLGAYLVLHGEITLGTLVAFLGVMGEVIGPVTSLTGVGQQVQTATGALVRVNEVLDTEPDIADAPGAVAVPPLQQQLELRGVSFSYTPEKRTLSDVTLVVPQGSRVAFVGPSGAGKSSVMQLLMRNYEPDLGAILLDGIDIRHVTLTSLREQMGVVFQDNFLFDTSIRENIRMGRPSATDEDIERAARAAEVHDFIAQLPRGYDTLVGERGGRLSGGQRQRVAIARALVRDPRILLLDEATSALDPRTERLINDTLERAGAGRTTIAVTHRLASVVDYDCIFVLSEGELVEQGRHADLLANGGVYASLWAEQMGTASAAATGVDVVTALRRVPLFANLDEQGLEEVVAALSGLELFPEQRLQEGQNLYLLLRGNARVSVPGFDGASEQTVTLAAGDSFGLGAALGQPTGAEMQAIDRLQLAVLDLAELPRLAARLPAVGAALGGQAGPRPESGQILGRLTIGPHAAVSAVPAAPAPVSLSEAVHQTGVLRPIR